MVRLVSGPLDFIFSGSAGRFSPEKLFQMRIIEYDEGPVAFQREVMGSRINEVCLSANQGGRRQLVDPVFRRHAVVTTPLILPAVIGFFGSASHTSSLSCMLSQR